MLKVDVLNMDGKKVEDIELNENVFGIEVNEVAVHTALVNFQANQRQGTQSTKTRSEVSGGGRKPWKQKGTGRARQGSIRATQWRGGGIAGGVQPRDYTFKINKKERVLAIKSALADKLKSNRVVVFENLELPSLKTKDIKNFMETNQLEGKVLFVTASDNENLYMASRNLGYTYVLYIDDINVYDIVNADTLVLDEAALNKLEEVLKNA